MYTKTVFRTNDKTDQCQFSHLVIFLRSCKMLDENRNVPLIPISSSPPPSSSLTTVSAFRISENSPEKGTKKVKSVKIVIGKMDNI